LFFQYCLKGIAGLDHDVALRILTKTGILSNWWRVDGIGRPEGWQARLSEENLMRHLNEYDKVPEGAHEPFGATTPFISTTAGAVLRGIDPKGQPGNYRLPPLLTAKRFATDDFTTTGHVFYGYVVTLGRKSVPLASFSEEVRDLLIYTSFLPFHDEGEIVAKLRIPAIQLSKFEMYGPKGDLLGSESNPGFEAPEQYANVRGSIE
jgi:hypothetical protein